MPLAMNLLAPREIRGEERESRPPESHEARIGVRMAGVCGTDLAIWSGGYRVPLPLVLGHEWVGTVLEMGSDGPGDLAGKQVTGEINNTCAVLGREKLCEACRHGLPSHCLERTVTGIVAHDGAFQRELYVPWRVLHEIPPGMSDEEALYVEPLAAALQTFELSPVGSEDFIVVLGAGRLGLLASLVARANGARVLAVVRSDERAARIRGLGLEVFQFDLRTRRPPEDPLAPATSPLLEAVLERTTGLGADVVVEATGSPEGLPTALDVVRPRGVIALKSTPGRPVPEFGLTRFVVNEVRLQGSRCGPFDKAIAFQMQHRLPLKETIVDQFPLDSASKALERAAVAAGKVAIQVGTP